MDTTLFEAFSPATADEWKARLEKDLKGVGFEDLSRKDRNGNTIRPFYTAEDLSDTDISACFSHKDWDTCARIQVKDDPVAANKQALHELSNGVSGLAFILQTELQAALLFKDIELQYIHTRCYVPVAHYAASCLNWSAYCAQQQSDPALLNIITDPIAAMLENGSEIEDTATGFAPFWNGTLYIDTCLYQNAGANSAFQLACTLAQTNEYLHRLSLQADTIVTRLDVSLSVSTDFFEEIAKLRALRYVLRSLLEEYGIKASIHLHVETSGTYRSRFDAYSNLLRDTIAGMAAVLGGCNSLCIHAFLPEADARQQDFAARMSRNQQFIFKEETYLHQVADVACGSYYLEQLSDTLATQAWGAFQAIETEGGILAARSYVQTTIAGQAAGWIEDYRAGSRVLIGINKYVNPEDKPVAIAKAPQLQEGISRICVADLLV